METNASERRWYLDILRVFAAFGVIMLHISPFGESPVCSAAWRTVNAWSNPFRASVPLFFMISGALYLDPKREISLKKLYGRSLLRLLTAFLFWSAVYAAVHCAMMDKGKWTFLNQLIRGHYHMWYLFSIAALYMAAPLLRRITADRRSTEYLLAAGFVMTFLLPRAIGFLQLFDLPHADVIDSLRSFVYQLNPYRGLTPLYYFVLGHYLHAYPLKRVSTRLAGLTALAGLAATGILYDWHAGLLGENASYFSDTASVNLLIAAAGLFLFAKRLMADRTPSERSGKILRLLSDSTFGIYLVHALFVEHLPLPLPLSAPGLLIAMPLKGLLIFAVSFLVSAPLGRIPGLKKTIV